jgi:hypothetical protein
MSVRFEPGSVVRHPELGQCTVTFVGKRYVGVVFDERRHALLRMDSFSAPPPSPPVPTDAGPDAEARAEATWPGNTFFPAGDTFGQFAGSHWDPFAADGIAYLRQLPEIAARARLVEGFGSFFTAPRPAPEHWHQGCHLIWPGPDAGISVTLRFDHDCSSVQAFFPCFGQGSEVRLQLHRVIAAACGVTGWIEAAWGEARVTFFDTQFVENRAWYEAGEEYDFILTGIAYGAFPSTVMSIPFEPDPDVVAWSAMLHAKYGREEPVISAPLSLAGMSVFHPIAEWDTDDYGFRGPVLRVIPVAGMLGQEGWLVRVRIMRFHARDAELDILITRHAWRGDAPPAVGQDIEGRLWLQGRLWSPVGWQEAGRQAHGVL